MFRWRDAFPVMTDATRYLEGVSKSQSATATIRIHPWHMKLHHWLLSFRSQHTWNSNNHPSTVMLKYLKNENSVFEGFSFHSTSDMPQNIIYLWRDNVYDMNGFSQVFIPKIRVFLLLSTCINGIRYSLCMVSMIANWSTFMKLYEYTNIISSICPQTVSTQLRQFCTCWWHRRCCRSIILCGPRSSCLIPCRSGSAGRISVPNGRSTSYCNQRITRTCQNIKL